MMYAEVAIATLLNIFKSMGWPYDRLKCTMYASLEVCARAKQLFIFHAGIVTMRAVTERNFFTTTS